MHIGQLYLECDCVCECKYVSMSVKPCIVHCYLRVLLCQAFSLKPEPLSPSSLFSDSSSDVGFSAGVVSSTASVFLLNWEQFSTMSGTVLLVRALDS